MRKFPDTTGFLHSGLQEIAEYDGSGALIRRFVPGAVLDEVVAVVAASGARLFGHYDALGSTVALSDEGGAIVERRAYGPYGEGAPPAGAVFGFAGARHDPESGLYYLRARYYSPVLGRFLSPDPAGFADGLNLYAYAGNDLVNFLDPLNPICSDSARRGLHQDRRAHGAQLPYQAADGRFGAGLQGGLANLKRRPRHQDPLGPTPGVSFFLISSNAGVSMNDIPQIEPASWPKRFSGEFPAPAFNLPVPPRNVPVQLRREFDEKYKETSRLKSLRGPRSGRMRGNSLYFPCFTGNSAETGSHQTHCTASKSLFSLILQVGGVGARRLEPARGIPWPPAMRNPFRYFNNSPEVIGLAVTMYIPNPPSPRSL